MGATKMLEDFLEVIEVEVSPRETEWVDNDDGGEWVETKPAEYRSQTVLREPNKDTKSQSDLERVINLGKPQVVVDRIRELVNLTNQWNWCYDYIYYLNDMEDWENWEAEVTYDDDGVELYRTEKPEEPIEPLRPADIVVNPVLLRKYPSIEEQLDYMYHNGLSKWKADMIKPVKDSHPKG